MGLFVMSIALGITSGCVIWLKVGNQMPFSREDKWSMPINLFVYSLLCASTIFVLFFVLA